MSGIPWPTILTSVIVAAASVLSTIAYNRWAESRRIRLDCFRQMCRHRVDDDAFLRSLNELPILFSGNKKVIGAHQSYIEAIDKYGSVVCDEVEDLILAMADDLGIRGVSRKQLLSRFSSSRK